jgi:RNA polymerase sigma-70 factor (ECF subfamily)
MREHALASEDLPHGFLVFFEPFCPIRRTSNCMSVIEDQLRQNEPPSASMLARAGPSTAPDEPADLAKLVGQHQASVWRYLRYLGADTSEAADLTQETFLAFARAKFAERDSRQTAGYLRTVARNQLLALRRRQKREVSTVGIEAADRVWAVAAGPAGDLTRYLDALRECVSQLEGRGRQAVDLHYRQDLDREAIALQLEMKPDGVKTLLRRTRQVLRECVERKLKLDSNG